QPLPSAQPSSTPGQTVAAQTPAPQAPPPTVLAEHISLPLIEDVRVTNKTSQNLHAEMDLRLAAKLDGMLPSFEGGAAAVQLLLYASHQPWGAAYQESLPVSGVDGSLAERFLNTPAGGLIHAKTGSLSHVNTLSGYGETRTGSHFVFSILCNNHDLPPGRVLSTIDSIVQLLVN